MGERPRVQRGPLGLAKPYPRTDPRQLFDGDTAPGALRLGHDAFGDLMIDVGGEAGLFTAPSSSAAAAPMLVFLACNRFRRPQLTFAVAVEPGAGGHVTVAAGGGGVTQGGIEGSFRP